MIAKELFNSHMFGRNAGDMTHGERVCVSATSFDGHLITYFCNDGAYTAIIQIPEWQMITIPSIGSLLPSALTDFHRDEKFESSFPFLLQIENAIRLDTFIVPSFRLPHLLRLLPFLRREASQ